MDIYTLKVYVLNSGGMGFRNTYGGEYIGYPQHFGGILICRLKARCVRLFSPLFLVNVFSQFWSILGVFPKNRFFGVRFVTNMYSKFGINSEHCDTE